MKTCTFCNEARPLSDYYKQKADSSKLRTQCKYCFQSYNQSEKGKVSHRKSVKKYNSKYPEKRLAHDTANNAIKGGHLVVQPCEVCGSDERAEMHHDDYSKPLDVSWLCGKHHAEFHAAIKVVGGRDD